MMNLPSYTTAQLKNWSASGANAVAPIFGMGAYDSALPVKLRHAPRKARDPYPWTDGVLRYRRSEVTLYTVKG